MLRQKTPLRQRTSLKSKKKNTSTQKGEIRYSSFKQKKNVKEIQKPQQSIRKSMRERQQEKLKERIEKEGMEAILKEREEKAKEKLQKKMERSIKREQEREERKRSGELDSKIFLPKHRRIESMNTFNKCKKPFCEICGKPTYGTGPHHIVTRGACGPDMEENLIQLCMECHHLAHSQGYSKEKLFSIVGRRIGKSSEEIEHAIRVAMGYNT